MIRLPDSNAVAAALAALLPVLSVLTGCGSSQFDDTYGRRRGSRSVAGTAVLGRLFEQSGHRVASWGRISPKLYDFEVIVWAPDDFRPPTLKQRAALEDWLADSPQQRTLVYIGRDYDALSAYWRAVMPAAPPGQWVESQKRLAQARAGHELERAGMPDSEYARWFTTERDGAVRKVTWVRSPDSDWDQGVDASKLDIIVEGQLRLSRQKDVPPLPGSTAVMTLDSDLVDLELLQRDQRLPDYEVLLNSNAGALVTRVTDPRWYSGQVLVVSNGSFLLNLPLVNHEHRKLARRLVEECGSAGNVVFLESGPGGPLVYETELEEGAPTGLELFTVWPIGLLMIHLLVIGVLACFAMFPFFGRPRTLTFAMYGMPVVDVNFSGSTDSGNDAPSSGHTDFGRHIDAVGRLLALTNGHQYVVNRLQQYHHTVKRDSGVSHALPTSDQSDESNPQRAP